MTSSLQIGEYFYELLNIDAITSVITGSVYRNQKIDDELENIVIFVNFLTENTNRGNQRGLVNVNILVKKEQGLHNISRIKTITDLVMNALDTDDKENESFYYKFQQNTGVNTLLEQNTISILNLRYEIFLNNF